MEDNNFVDEDFDITEHIIKKDGTGWEEKWNQPNTPYRRIYKMPEYRLNDIPVIKSNEPWYRKFENNKRKRR